MKYCRRTSHRMNETTSASAGRWFPRSALLALLGCAATSVEPRADPPGVVVSEVSEFVPTARAAVGVFDLWMHDVGGTQLLADAGLFVAARRGVDSRSKSVRIRLEGTDEHLDQREIFRRYGGFRQEFSRTRGQEFEPELLRELGGGYEVWIDIGCEQRRVSLTDTGALERVSMNRCKWVRWRETVKIPTKRLKKIFGAKGEDEGEDEELIRKHVVDGVARELRKYYNVRAHQQQVNVKVFEEIGDVEIEVTLKTGTREVIETKQWERIKLAIETRSGREHWVFGCWVFGYYASKSRQLPPDKEFKMMSKEHEKSLENYCGKILISSVRQFQ